MTESEKSYQDTLKELYLQEYNHKQYLKRKENGLCVRCGKPNNNGKVHCDICREKMKEYHKQTYIPRPRPKQEPQKKDHKYYADLYAKQRKQKGKLPRSEWVGAGMCYLCGQPQWGGVQSVREALQNNV